MTRDPISGRRLGVLISGRGSNLQALIDAVANRRLDAVITVVISNREDAGGLDRARRAGIETICLSHRGWSSRDDYDRALVKELQQRRVDVVCLAGFMRVLGRAMIEAFPNRILNIHPSLLPSFPGVDAQRQAFEHGVKVAGVTVHLVTTELDSGPIVLAARRTRPRDRYGRHPGRTPSRRGAPCVRGSCEDSARGGLGG
jgi:phosphoribosylglycinamide formyltransferase-1